MEAAQRAILSPLLEETSIDGARGVLLNIASGHDLTCHEVAEAARIISEAVDRLLETEPSRTTFIGRPERVQPTPAYSRGQMPSSSHPSNSCPSDEMKVTVIATGFDVDRVRRVESQRRPVVQPQRNRPRILRDGEPEESAGEPEESRESRPASFVPTQRPRIETPPPAPSPAPAADTSSRDLDLVPPEPEEHEVEENVPFYRKMLAHNQPEDPGGYGPNWSNVDDYDIPTVLRKQMD